MAVSPLYSFYMSDAIFNMGSPAFGLLTSDKFTYSSVANRENNSKVPLGNSIGILATAMTDQNDQHGMMPYFIPNLKSHFSDVLVPMYVPSIMANGILKLIQHNGDLYYSGAGSNTLIAGFLINKL